MWIAALLCEPSKISDEGRLHELFVHDGITLATWGLFLVTALLVFYGWQTGKRQAARWTLEDEQRKGDLDELHARWRRDDQSTLIQRLDMIFNSAGMLSTRRLAGKSMLSRDAIRDLQQYVPAPASPIVNFFERVASLWESGELPLDAIDMAYREYLFRIWADYDKHLLNEWQEGRYQCLKRLKEALQEIDEHRRTDDIAAVIHVVRDEFWRRESEL